MIGANLKIAGIAYITSTPFP